MADLLTQMGCLPWQARKLLPGAKSNRQFYACVMQVSQIPVLFVFDGSHLQDKFNSVTRLMSVIARAIGADMFDGIKPLTSQVAERLVIMGDFSEQETACLLNQTRMGSCIAPIITVSPAQLLVDCGHKKRFWSEICIL